MKTRLIVARHGNTFVAGETPRRVGSTDLPLVESGLKQGLQLGEALKAMHLLPEVIFTSGLQRTQQTAMEAQKALGTTLPIHPLAMFNEIDYGPDENQTEPQVLARIGQKALDDWESQAKVPLGWQANPETLIKNWQHFAKNLLEQQLGKTILVVTSNGIARFAPYLTNDFKGFCQNHRIKLATGAFGVLIHEDSQPDWQCLSWNIKK